jgi:dipeptidyl aminopeptidase/acylaminoacyl peptidase
MLLGISRWIGSLACLAPALVAMAAEPTLPIPENLVVDGVPAIPAAVTEKAAPYTEARAATLTSWHPTRREMLISTRFGNTNQAHVVKSPGGARTQVTFFADPVSNASFEPTKGEYLVYSKGAGGDEFFQLYRMDLANGAVTLLTDGKSRNSAANWSPSGRSIAYTSTRRTKADTDLYVMNPLDPTSDRLLAQNKGGGWQVEDWSPDEKKLLVLEEISINESYLWLFDVATGERTALTPADAGAKAKVAYGLARFARDGKGIYLTTDKDSEFLWMGYLDLATKKVNRLIEGERNWDVDAMAVSKDGRLLAFTTNESGVSVVRILETKSLRELAGPKLPEYGVVTGLRWSSDNSELGYNFTSARSPNDVYSYNVTNGKLDRWTEGETGGLNAKAFSEPELIRWSSFDRREISGFLYLPPEKFKGKRPVIINIHGGPESQFRPGFIARNNYFLNEMGCAVIFPNVRGSSGFGKTFLTLDNGRLRENSYRDLGALLDWIKAQPQLDASRIMVTGGSYGGHMTLVVATFYPERIRCAVSVVGISNLVTFLKNTEAYRRDLRRVEYGDERDPEMAEYLERIAPMNHAEKIRAPMFIVQGRNDPRVPYTEAEQIVGTLKNTSTPVWYLLAKDEGHGFQKKANADFQFYSTILFMQRYLLN